MSDKIEKKVQEALGRHDRGYNCSQSVACTFCDELGFDEETMFRITEGMGLGMGSMDGTCGAIGAAAVLAGMKNSTVNAMYAAVRKPGACTGFWGRNAAKPVFYTKCRI